MSKRTNTYKGMRAACSLVLAAGLCWPAGLAFAQEDPGVQRSSSGAFVVGQPVFPDASETPGEDAASQGGVQAGPNAQAAGEADEAAERAARAKADEAWAALAQAESALDRVPGLVSKLRASSESFQRAAADVNPVAKLSRKLRDRADEAANALPELREQVARARGEAVEQVAESMALTVTRSALQATGKAKAPTAEEVAAKLADPIAAPSSADDVVAVQDGGEASEASSPQDAGSIASVSAAAWATVREKKQGYHDMFRKSFLRDIGAKQVEAEVSRRSGKLLNLAESGNDAAFEIELALADARKAYRVAQEAVDSIPDSVAGAAELKAEVAARVLSIDERRAGYQADVAAWYELAEDAVGAQGALSFGAGVDFGLPEDEFVAKWGAAIDAFYKEYGAPLFGYGEAMAKSAYRWRIDPRLCAAVSVTESSGGRYCIRPHNAWGWGAADSDPYGLAWQWGSWEDAIESWHRGVATNTNGLATARTLTAFGEIYASSPHWATNTAASMRRIVAQA